jgi:ATP-dependent RNA helicase DDX24/MAK5
MGDLMSKQESMEYLLRKLNFREEKPKFIDVNPVQQMAVGLKEGLVECAGPEKVSLVFGNDCSICADRALRTYISTHSYFSTQRLVP